MQLEAEHPACDLCGATAQRVLFPVKDRRYRVPGEFQLVECPACALRYVSPRPVAGAIAAWYPQTYPAHNRAGRSRFDAVVDFFDDAWHSFLGRFLRDSYPIYFYPRHAARFAVAGRAPRILDIGCGSGNKLRYLRRKAGWDTFGVDFNAQAVANANASGAGEVHLSTGDRLPFPDGHFDAVMSWHSLEHHHSPRRTMNEVLRVLRPGGYGIFAVPSGDNLGLRLFRSYWGPLEAPRHLYHFTEKTFVRLLDDVGLAVHKVFHDFTFYGLFLDEEILDSLEYLIQDLHIPFKIPRIPSFSSLARLPVLLLSANDRLGKLWRGSNLIFHFTKPAVAA